MTTAVPKNLDLLAANEHPKAVGVLVPMPAARPYTYGVPQSWQVESGSIVQVPLGPRLVSGVVWDGAPDEVDAKKLKPLGQLFDCPPLDAPMRRFIERVGGKIGRAHV